MAFHVDLRPNSGDLTRFVDEEGRSLDPEMFAAVEVLFLPDPVGFCDPALVVAEQREIEVVLVPELGVARSIVPTHPKDDGSLRLDAAKIVPEAAGFFRA